MIRTNKIRPRRRDLSETRVSIRGHLYFDSVLPGSNKLLNVRCELPTPEDTITNLKKVASFVQSTLERHAGFLSVEIQPLTESLFPIEEAVRGLCRDVSTAGMSIVTSHTEVTGRWKTNHADIVLYALKVTCSDETFRFVAQLNSVTEIGGFLHSRASLVADWNSQPRIVARV